MAELYPYPRFSLAERDRRWRAVRELMRRDRLDVIVTPQNTGHSMDYQANTRYLTHVGGGGDSDIAAVFPLDGEVTAIATSAAPRWPTVQEWTKDVRVPSVSPRPVMPMRPRSTPSSLSRWTI